jgi:hypothetical protein
VRHWPSFRRGEGEAIEDRRAEVCERNRKTKDRWAMKMTLSILGLVYSRRLPTMYSASRPTSRIDSRVVSHPLSGD